MIAGDYGYTLTLPTDTDLTGYTSITLNLRKPDGSEQSITSCTFTNSGASPQVGIYGFLSWPVASGQLNLAGTYRAQFSYTAAGVSRNCSPFTFVVSPTI